jgi:8-oxo-dGTP pyrophosphatase MutT (NUDIX family)
MIQRMPGLVQNQTSAFDKVGSLGMLRAYAMYLEKKAQSDKLYRDRIEVYAIKDGKLLGGVYPDGNFGVFGGGIDPGETAKKAAKREFLEESGYEIKHLHPAYIPAVKSRWSEDDKKRLAKKDPSRIKQYQGSRTIFFIADLGDRQTKHPEDKAKLKHVKLYPFEEVLDLLHKSGDNQRLLDARIKLVRNLIKYEKSAQLLEPLLAIR